MVDDNFSTHKQRSEWFRERVAFPLRDAHPGTLETFWGKQVPEEKWKFRWSCAGPFNVAGRCTSLVVDPDNPKRLFAGAATGGVWASTDGGVRWKSAWQQWINANIGALAMHPLDSKVLFAATGEADLSADTYPGSGIYVSRDRGAKWEMLAAADACGLPRRIGAIHVDPSDETGQRMYLGGVSFDETMPAGLYISEDGGKTWLRDELVSENNYYCHSIAFHPNGPVFAAVNARGAQSGVWRKMDGVWKQLAGGFPSGDKVGRISLAVAQVEPFTVYALVASSRGGPALGVYRSAENGDNWELAGSEHLANDTQMSYNNCIAVHPVDANFVMCGGNNLYLTRDGGATWGKSSDWDEDAGNPLYAHGDHHAIVLPGGGLVYSANDGGIAVSLDGGASWEQNVGRGMANTMFYDVSVAPKNSRIFGGGTQDNGTLIAGIGGKRGDFQQVLFGDGGWMVIDPDDHTHMFGLEQNISIHRHTDPTRWENDFWDAVPVTGMPEFEARQAFIARMIIDPEKRADGQVTLWVGSRRLWRTTDSGATWEHVSPFFDGTTVSAIEVSPVNPKIILAGTSKGGIYRSDDGGENWSGNLAGPEVPARFVSHIAAHPAKANIIVMTIAGSGRVAKVVDHPGYMPGMSGYATQGIHHVFLSEDDGVHWRPIDPNYMPDVACHTAVFETRKPHRLFVGTDCGVWMAENFETWSDVTGSLPTVMVAGLAYHPDRILTAATYGRGIWRLRVPPVKAL